MADLTIIYPYNGQDGKLSDIKKHVLDNVRSIIVDFSGFQDISSAYEKALSSCDGWIVLARIERVVDRENAIKIIQMKKELGNLYLLDNGDAKLFHISEYSNINNLKQQETKILFDLWDTQPTRPTITDKNFVNARLQKISDYVEVMKVI